MAQKWVLVVSLSFLVIQPSIAQIPIAESHTESRVEKWLKSVSGRYAIGKQERNIDYIYTGECPSEIDVRGANRTISVFDAKGSEIKDWFVDHIGDGKYEENRGTWWPTGYRAYLRVYGDRVIEKKKGLIFWRKRISFIKKADRLFIRDNSGMFCRYYRLKEKPAESRR